MSSTSAAISGRMPPCSTMRSNAARLPLARPASTGIDLTAPVGMTFLSNILVAPPQDYQFARWPYAARAGPAASGLTNVN
jgi:hypothetical protein